MASKDRSTNTGTKLDHKPRCRTSTCDFAAPGAGEVGSGSSQHTCHTFQVRG